MRNKKEFKGKTVESAIKKGLKKLDLNKDEVNVEILDEGKAGLFGLMGAEPAKIQLEVKGGSRKKTDPDIDWKYSLSRAEEFFGLLIKSIDKEAASKIEKNESGISVDIKSGDSSLFIGKEGDTLKALEYIFNLIMKRDPRSRVNVELDIEGYKKRKVKDIIRQAKTIAQKVKKSGKSEELSPMKASKRKKIHKAISGIDGIDTASVGEGSSRRVKITKT